MVNENNMNNGDQSRHIMINSNSLESVPSISGDSNGPRPQSVSSIHTTTSNTPTTYEELQSKLENSNRNIANIKEQQQQLLRLQQAAKNQLYEMEQLRAQQGPISLSNTSDANAVPDYGNVDEVAQDVGALMLRMKTLTDFIHNQNDLASSLGVDEKMELMEEQTQLQQKLMLLKNKKQEMASLVNELQSMNNNADNNFHENDSSNAEMAAANLMYERMPIDQLNDNDKDEATIQQNSTDDLNDDGCEDDIEQNGLIKEKIDQINSMKDQLKRLKDMMHTVKLIEIKNGDRDPNDDENMFIDKSNECVNMDLQTKDDPQRDVEEEEQEMAERVRALHSMTNDLRQQAVSLAAERDRLKDIKNEMARRREFDGSEKNFKPQPQPEEIPQEVKASLTLNTKRAPKPQENNSEMTPKNCYSPNWMNRRNVSSTPSIQSSHGGNHNDNLLMKQPAFNQGKDSTDSGAAELNMSVEAASTQSCSSRGFSVPPPMRNIGARDGTWLKASQDISRMSSLNNQTANGYENQTEQNYPWYWHCNQSCNSAAPQSPHCYYHHHMCAPNSSQVSATNNDPVLMQQFIQTQQMLINSMSQCNQLLWDQQREINNLNSAVLLIQERLLNSGHSFVDPTQSAMLRAESVPPNVVCTNASPFLPRAQSEQPQNFPNYPPSTVGSMQRNNQHGSRLLRQPISNQNYHQLTPNRYPMCSQFTPNSLSIDPTEQLHYPNNNNFLNNLNHQQNLTNNSNSATSSAVTNSNVNATNNVTALNNQVPPGIRANNYYDNFRSYSRQNLLSSGSCKSNEVEQPQVQMTHNNLPTATGNKFRNQINQNTPPDVLNINQQRHFHGIMDNYNTNSRDYAMEKLRCNSIELPAHGTSAKNGTFTDYSDNAQAASTSSLMSTVPSNGSGNESNLLNSIANHNNNDNNRSNAEDQKAINSYNFDVNELKQPKMSTKTLQKGSTKRVRPLRDMSYASSINERDQSSTNSILQNLQDLNLVSTSNQRTNSKSPTKLFDDLKENVYLEVSALIAANESRPHFLINLFRELQLISSSDPLRKRLMQAFQEVYTNGYESNANILPDVQTSLPNNQDELENLHRNILPPADIQRHDEDMNNGRNAWMTPQPLFRRKVTGSASKKSPIDVSHHTYLDLAEKQESERNNQGPQPILLPKPNDLFPTLCRKEGSDQIEPPKTLADVVVIPSKPKFISSSSSSSCQQHSFIPNGNQDLAEADQICSENNNGAAAVTNDILRSDPDSPVENGGFPSETDILDDISGAIGGIDTPILPDLAKVMERDDVGHHNE